jgi:hypothetical protein
VPSDGNPREPGLALPLSERAWDLYRCWLGDDHLHTLRSAHPAATLTNLNECNQARGREE